MKEIWNRPQIEALDIENTAWESRTGTNADGYEYRCDPLYS